MNAEIHFAIDTALRHAARRRGRLQALTLTGTVSAERVWQILSARGLESVELTLEPGPGPVRLVAIELSQERWSSPHDQERSATPG